MADAAATVPMTASEYLAFERASEEKHTFLAGELFAMSGGTRAHSLVASNFVGELGRVTRSLRCEVHGSDLRVHIPSTGLYTYPDALVVCGPRFLDESHDTLLNPVVLVEVLSDATERFDRGDKFAHYRSIESLRDYVIASQRAPLVEHYERRERSWVLRPLSDDDTLVLSGIEAKLPVRELYAKVFDAIG